jgi:hypothetical protein
MRRRLPHDVGGVSYVGCLPCRNLSLLGGRRDAVEACREARESSKTRQGSRGKRCSEKRCGNRANSKQLFFLQVWQVVLEWGKRNGLQEMSVIASSPGRHIIFGVCRQPCSRLFLRPWHERQGYGDHKRTFYARFNAMRLSRSIHSNRCIIQGSSLVQFYSTLAI